MEAVIGGLILWVYVLSGLIAVPIAMGILVWVYERPIGHSFGVATAGWYLGAPLILIFYSAISVGIQKREIKANQEKYMELCQKHFSEKIIKVSENVQWINMDSGESNREFLIPMTTAFGQSFRSVVYELLNIKFNKYSAFNKQLTEISSLPGTLILKVRLTQHIPYAGAFYATGFHIELIDKDTGDLLAERITFAHKNGGFYNSNDCQPGKKLINANTEFLRKAIRHPTQ